MAFSSIVMEQEKKKHSEKGTVTTFTCIIVFALDFFLAVKYLI